VLYVAVPVFGGAVRLAYPLADIAVLQQQSEARLVYGSLIAAAIGLLLSALTAWMVAR
jgi:hypothetical protein